MNTGVDDSSDAGTVFEKGNAGYDMQSSQASYMMRGSA